MNTNKEVLIQIEKQLLILTADLCKSKEGSGEERIKEFYKRLINELEKFPLDDEDFDANVLDTKIILKALLFTQDAIWQISPQWGDDFEDEDEDED